MFFFVFRLSVMINSTGPEDAICSYSKLLSANWMTPVNTTGHVVFILVSFARLRTTKKKPIAPVLHTHVHHMSNAGLCTFWMQLAVFDWLDLWGCVPVLGLSLVSELWGSAGRGEMSGGLCQKGKEDSRVKDRLVPLKVASKHAEDIPWIPTESLFFWNMWEGVVK